MWDPSLSLIIQDGVIFLKSFGCKCVLNKLYPSDYHFRRWRLFAVEMWLPKKKEA